jgi:ubiquinone/menaquinone biosynthesis C-methylase UbiE
MDTNDTEQAYAYLAPRYDEGEGHRTSGDLAGVEEIVVLSLLRHISFHDVLDAATGTGRYAVRLAQMGKHVVGIDVSEPMLAQARAKARQLGLDIEFHRASVLAAPQANESFDLVICALALAHVKDLAGAVRELVRVLRCGGHLIISDLHPNIQKLWGPDYTAVIKDGRLLISGAEKDAEDAWQCQQVPFPQYHGNISEYLDSIKAAGAEVLAAIDVPMEQGLGLLPGPLVIFARKSEHGTVESAVSADARNSRG